jgi:DNA-binding HxlR family transcriptional regulator
LIGRIDAGFDSSGYVLIPGVLHAYRASAADLADWYGRALAGKPLAARRSCCPVACTLDLIGDRWTPLVVRDLLAGKSRFADFQRSPERIATNILAARLQTLVSQGLVERVTGQEGDHPVYRLNDRSRVMSTGAITAATPRRMRSAVPTTCACG